MPETSGAPRDRRVFLIMAALVVAILIINVVSAVVPGMDGSLAAWPIVIAILVGGTIVVLAVTLRR